jgi:hypothetical protein
MKSTEHAIQYVASVCLAGEFHQAKLQGEKKNRKKLRTTVHVKVAAKAKLLIGCFTCRLCRRKIDFTSTLNCWGFAWPTIGPNSTTHLSGSLVIIQWYLMKGAGDASSRGHI